MRAPDRGALADLVRGSEGPLAIVAGGTRRAPPAHAPGAPGTPAIVDVRGLSRIVEYDPAEMVITAEAGATWDTIDALLAPNRQRAGVHPPLPSGATLGGLVAADACGPHRHRLGSWRDQVLGLRMILADGREIRAGGKVVKNVAGYDLCKLAVGSFGHLGVITELSLRLHPRPEVTVVGRLSAADIAPCVAQIRQLPVEPVGLIVSRTPDAGSLQLALALEGRPAAVSAQRDVLEHAVAGDWAWEEDVTLTAGLDERYSQARATNAAILRGGLPRPLQILETARADLPPGAHQDVDPGTGEARWFLPDPTPDFALETRRSLEAQGGFLVIEEGLPDLDPWGTEPEGAFLAKRIKEELDPENRWGG